MRFLTRDLFKNRSFLTSLSQGAEKIGSYNHVLSLVVVDDLPSHKNA
ncbi:hypothetical protein SDC9_172626 [bioreactor metagenome]|uniref:Uncharacterized protein n=1 Tax=bioreactor metagenome TaxID=1076179 RepID=A0A645GHF4_9ZZZZ